MAAREVPDGWVDYARSFGIALQRQRLRIGLTQEQLAHAAGMTRSHYQQLEKGASRPGTPANPSLLTIISLASALGIEPRELFDGLADVDVVTGRRQARGA